MANAAFTDDFDSNTAGNNYVWAAGNTIVGNNGWQSFYNASTTPVASTTITAAGSGIDNTKGFYAMGHGLGMARDVSGDVAGGVYQASVMANVSPTNAEMRLYVGDSNILTGTAPYLSYAAVIKYNGSFALEWWTPGYGYATSGAGGFDTALGWVELVIDVNMNAGTGTGTLNDVDDNTGAFISQLLQYNYAAPGFASIQAAGALTNWWGDGDNFASTPEPVTLSILALAGGLALLRRRRARACRKQVARP